MFKTTQTKILGASSLLAILIGFLFYMLKGEVYKSGSFLFFAGVPLLINLYTVHCVIFGKCTVYSWLLTAVLTLYAIGIFILYAKLIVKGQEIKNLVKDKTTEANTLQTVVENALGMTY